MSESSGSEASASTASPALDEALERLAASGFELPNGFVNHGPMACEALATLGCEDDIDEWARLFARRGGVGVTPVAPAEAAVAAGDGPEGDRVDAAWRSALGQYGKLSEWIGRFEQAIEEEGWPAVVEVWVPRLMPGLSVALFHGAIRTAHAVRAVAAADTPPRRSELARALAYWAARFRPGQRAEAGEQVQTPDEVRGAVVRAAAGGARRYLARPTIINLHGVTGAMAVELMVDHLSPAAAAAALAQVEAEHAVLYRDTSPVSEVQVAAVEYGALAAVAAESRDPHQVKLVEACRRGSAQTGDPAFDAAAEVVVAR
jgi:hypothetical protein